MKTLPQRIQRRRTKGFRLPEGTICVSRPSKWGNPYRVGKNTGLPLEQALDRYRHWLFGQIAGGKLDLDDLRGAKFLACWCPLGRPCHVDVLLEALGKEVPLLLCTEPAVSVMVYEGGSIRISGPGGESVALGSGAVDELRKILGPPSSSLRQLLRLAEARDFVIIRPLHDGGGQPTGAFDIGLGEFDEPYPPYESFLEGDHGELERCLSEMDAETGEPEC